MKGIIIDKLNKTCFALTDDGSVREVKNRGYDIGDVVDVTERRKMFSGIARLGAGLAAALAICAIGAFVYMMPVVYVSVEVNPSVEISLNKLERVISVEGINDDGKKIVKQLKLRHQSVETAIKKLIDELITDGYLNKKGKGDVLIATYGLSAKDSKLAVNLQKKVEEVLAEFGIQADVEAFSVSHDAVKEAADLGLSPGRYSLVARLMGVAEGIETILMADLQDKTIAELDALYQSFETKRRKAARLAEEALLETPPSAGKPPVIVLKETPPASAPPKWAKPGAPGPVPQTPIKVENPVAPSAPENSSGGSNKPANPPVTPDPANPGQPANPDNPANPPDSEDPAAPGQPVNPPDSGDSANPGASPDPSNPGASPDPSNPGASPGPANPGTSPDPSNPGTSPGPANPGTSPNPANPGTSPNPSNPDNSTGQPASPDPAAPASP
jgi:hypothetical protein